MIELDVYISGGVSGCPVDSGLDAAVIFHVDLGMILNSHDSLPSHFYGTFYLRVDTVQVFSETVSVVTVQVGV